MMGPPGHIRALPFAGVGRANSDGQGMAALTCRRCVSLRLDSKGHTRLEAKGVA